MKFLSIKTKLITLFTLFLAVNSVFIYLFFPSTIRDQAIQSRIDKANAIVAMTAFSISHALQERDLFTIDETFQNARHNPDVEYIVVIDDSGRVFTSYAKVKADIGRYKQTPRGGALTEQGDVFRTVTPVHDRGRLLGHLYMGFSLRQVLTDIRWSKTTIALVSLLMFIVGTIVVHRISIFATGSLRHMVQTAERIAKGDLKRRASISSNDEVSYLARSFNQMVDRLESARREMENLNKTLEGRVKERTRELLIENAERKQAEEKIREQAALLNISQDAIIVRNLDDTVAFWSRGAELLYGWESDQVVGQLASDILQTKTSEKFREANETLLAKGEWRGEMRQVTKDAREIMVEGRWTLVRDISGNPKSVLMVNTDITEKKVLEKQFLRAQRVESIGTLAGGIAHDLNNVLAPILMSVEVFRSKFTDEASQRMLGSLENSARRGAEMVKQVLTFARGVEGERMTLQPKHLIKEMQSIVTETFPKSIEIHTRVTKDALTISGDATQLHQVLLNLCVNARDAMPDGGILTLALDTHIVDAAMAGMHAGASPGPHVVISVSDTGCGISSDVIDNIFDPFFTTKEVGVGTGLGLSTVLSIVKSHDGFITVNSEVGKGSEFQIYLPAAQTDEAKKTAREASTMPSGKGELILIVDDEAAICQITKTTLESFGYQTITANDGTEGVALHAKHHDRIKVIITDMMMPMMSGPEMIRTIRSTDHEVRIIATSGLSSGYAGLNEDYIDAILPKPYTADRLLGILRELLETETERAS